MGFQTTYEELKQDCPFCGKEAHFYGFQTTYEELKQKVKNTIGRFLDAASRLPMRN